MCIYIKCIEREREREGRGKCRRATPCRSAPASSYNERRRRHAGCRGTSRVRNRDPPGPYGRTIPRVLW